MRGEDGKVKRSVKKVIMAFPWRTEKGSQVKLER
jgi:hypothetical protein